MMFRRVENPSMRCAKCKSDDVETVYRNWVVGSTSFYEVTCKRCSNKLMFGFRRAGFRV